VRYPFVAIEGPDGTGKTTLRKGLFRLWDVLYEITPLCVLTTNFLDADVAGDLVEGKYSPTSANRDRYLKAIVADKTATLERLVIPVLPQRPVIADRWILSELAFFAVKHAIEPPAVYERLAAGITRAADLTFVLDAPPADSIPRAHGRPGDATRVDWDVLEVQTRLRDVYATVIESAGAYPLLGEVVRLDARVEPASVLHSAWLALDERKLIPAVAVPEVP
jgi:dTMP kinase